MTDDAIRRARVARGAGRLLRVVTLSVGVAALVGCGSFWPWSGPSKPKPAELPAVNGSARLATAWRVPVGKSGLGFLPVVAAGSVFASSRDGAIVRVDAGTGRVLWRVNVGKPLVGGVGSDGETTVVAAADGALVAFDAEGKQRWTVPLGAEAVSVPVVAEGLVLVRGSDNRVTAFEADSGRRKWSFQRQSPTLVLRQTNAITVASSTAYVGLPGGRFVALGVQGGAVRWEAPVAQPRGATEIERITDVVGVPRLEGRELCAVAFQGKLACLDALTGRTVWSRDVSSATGVDVDPRIVVTVDDKDHLLAFARTGASQWKQDKLALRRLSAPLAVAAHVVVGDGGGLVHVFAKDDGAAVARIATDGSAILAPPVSAGGRIVVQTSGGELHGLALD